MNTPFYAQFETATYPCYWLGDDGEFWINRAAQAAPPPHGDRDIIQKLLSPLVFSRQAQKQTGTFSLPLLTDALRLQRLNVLPVEGGLFAVILNEAEPSVTAFSTQLREPLANIFAVLPLLSNRLDSTDLEYTDEVQENCYSLLRLASNIENAGRLESKYYELQSVDFTALVDSILVSSDSVCKEQGVPFEWQLPDKPLIVKADARLLSEAILNIMRNSLQYTRDGNRITVRMYQSGHRAVLRIADRGLGIKTEHLEKIFDPYFSVDPYGDGSPNPGVGIGLAMAQRTVYNFGGTITAESRFGEGTSITLAIPLVKDEQQATDSLPADYLLNRYSPIYIQLSGFCRLPSL